MWLKLSEILGERQEMEREERHRDHWVIRYMAGSMHFVLSSWEISGEI